MKNKKEVVLTIVAILVAIWLGYLIGMSTNTKTEVIPVGPQCVVPTP